MTNSEFNVFLKDRLDELQEVLGKKQAEYASDGNRFANFEEASRITDSPREKVAWFFAMKHFVSVKDIIDNIDKYVGNGNNALINEKFGDLINYLLLINAMLYEKASDDSNKTNDNKYDNRQYPTKTFCADYK